MLSFTVTKHMVSKELYEVKMILKDMYLKLLIMKPKDTN